MSSKSEPMRQPVRPLLENDHLRTFVTIAETGSFSRAAEHLFRTPSAISMQMKKLEETLGRSFFERSGRGVNLSPDGKELADYARRILRINDDAVSHFTAPELSGRVRIGTPDDFAPHMLPEAFGHFARAYPSVQVEVICDMSVQLVKMLSQGKVDIILVTNDAETAKISGTVVLAEPLVWAGCRSGEAWQRRPVPLALCHDGCSWRDMALDALDSAGIANNIAYLSQTYAGQLSAIMADLAIAPLPRSFAQGDLWDVTEESGLPPLGSYELRLLRSEKSNNPVHEALACHILDSFRPYAPTTGSVESEEFELA